MRNSKVSLARAALVLALSVVASSAASAMPQFLEDFEAQYPNVVGTRLDTCSVCHRDFPAFPRRNPYGLDYNLAGRRFPPIEPIDSDGDGADNLTEIMALTFPGDPFDSPFTSPTVSPTPTPTPSPAATATILPGPCYGDCNGDGRVTVDELVLSAEIALGTGAGECMLADGDGQVTVDELVKAVYRALRGCPPP